jgi:hypothetical protein
MTNVGGYVLSSAISGMVGGAIGGAAGAGSDHPVIKGALVTGAVSALVALIFAAGTDAKLPASSGVSGLQPRFP